MRRAKEVVLLPYPRGVHIEPLTVGIVVQRQAHTELVLGCEFCLKHQLCIAGFLVYIVGGKAETVIGIVHRTIEHQCHRRIVVGVEHKPVFPL